MFVLCAHFSTLALVPDSCMARDLLLFRASSAFWTLPVITRLNAIFTISNFILFSSQEVIVPSKKFPLR